MTAPLNALDQLPSGDTLAALRERAVLFGGNGCEVPAPDLLCLLDTLDEARRAVDDAHTYHADGFEAAVAECDARQAVRDAELAKLREQLSQLQTVKTGNLMMSDEKLEELGWTPPNSCAGGCR